MTCWNGSRKEKGLSISREDNIVAAQKQSGSLPIETEERIAAQEQHSLPRSILLHLLPGFFIFVLLLLIGPLLQSAGFPPFSFTAMLIGTVVLGATLFCCSWSRFRVALAAHRTDDT